MRVVDLACCVATELSVCFSCLFLLFFFFVSRVERFRHRFQIRHRSSRFCHKVSRFTNVMNLYELTSKCALVAFVFCVVSVDRSDACVGRQSNAHQARSVVEAERVAQSAESRQNNVLDRAEADARSAQAW